MAHRYGEIHRPCAWTYGKAHPNRLWAVAAQVPVQLRVCLDEVPAPAKIRLQATGVALVQAVVSAHLQEAAPFGELSGSLLEPLPQGSKNNLLLDAAPPPLQVCRTRLERDRMHAHSQLEAAETTAGRTR